MIVGEDSPLRRLPQALNRKQTLFIDGIRYSVEMADLAHARLQQNLYRLAMSDPNSGNASKLDRMALLSAIQDAWSIVDSLHRLRGLLQQMPGAKQKSPGMRIFKQKTDQVGGLRNGVQHLNQQINTVVSANQTAWGTLSWFALTEPNFNRGIVSLLIAGTVFTTEGHFPVNPMGKEVHSAIDHVTLTAYGHSLDLSDTMRRTERLIRDMEDQFRSQFADYPTAASELLVNLHFEFNGPEQHEQA